MLRSLHCSTAMCCHLFLTMSTPITNVNMEHSTSFQESEHDFVQHKIRDIIRIVVSLDVPKSRLPDTKVHRSCTAPRHLNNHRPLLRLMKSSTTPRGTCRPKFILLEGSDCEIYRIASHFCRVHSDIVSLTTTLLSPFVRRRRL